jgi:DnaD/phage-associated family protein
MNGFNGFPARMEYTPVPNIFLNSVLAEITDMAELRLTLHLFRLLYFKKSSPQYVTVNELLSDTGLMSGMNNNEEILRQALVAVGNRNTILHAAAEDGKHEDIYLLNTAANRESVGKIENTEIRLTGFETKRVTPEVPAAVQPNIFTMYEENIGLLTPMIAEELRDAEKTYPEVWIKDAIKEAVNAGKRNWRYIAAILKRWETEGKSDGTHLRDFKKTDPDKFIKGKYGHAVKR